MKQRADLPLATFLATITFGTVFGVLGAIIATPLAVVLVAIKQEVYEKNVLKAFEGE